MDIFLFFSFKGVGSFLMSYVFTCNKSACEDKREEPIDNLKRAFKATISVMSVYSTSIVFDVKETRNNVFLDCKPGPC